MDVVQLELQDRVGKSHSFFVKSKNFLIAEFAEKQSHRK